MNIFESTEILNLDSIAESTIIVGTVDGKRIILNKEQLFQKLGRRRKDRKKVAPAKPVKQ
jgi:hypothetical protein